MKLQDEKSGCMSQAACILMLSCIIPDDGLGIKTETLDCLMNWFIAVFDDKSDRHTTYVGAAIRSLTQTGLQEFNDYIVSVAAMNSAGHGTQTQMFTTMSSSTSIM